MKYVLIVFFGSLIISCNPNREACPTNASIVYDGFSTCEYFIDIDGELYEVSNLDSYSNTYFDGQNIRIDYQEMINVQPICLGKSVIEIFCYEELQ